MVINVTTSEFYPFTQRNFLKRYQKKKSTPFFMAALNNTSLI